MDDIISRLNQDFSAHNISFNNFGSDFIDNSTYIEVYPSEFDNLIAINNNPNAINIYLVNSAVGFIGKAAKVLSQSIVITKEYSDSGIISHEMGHCLNLLHTHSTQFGVENADNCTYAGDQICDTPPDSGLLNSSNPINPYYVDQNCNYTKGDGYNPDTENIMSYTSPNCLNHFTDGQAIRMRDAILNTSFLQSTVNCSCSVTALLGKETICSSETTTYSISCGNATFIKSSNLQTISTTSNSIIVKPINTSINRVAFVKTTIGGTTYQKDIWIGKPKFDVKFTPDVNYVYLELEGINSDIHKQNITYIEWETLSTTGNANMGTAINSFDNLAHGNSTNWIINSRIKVVNACDTTFVYKDIAPPVPLPCDDYYKIYKTNEKEYSTFKIINPCLRTSNDNPKKEKVKDHNIVKAVLYDIYGNIVKTYKSNSLNIKNLKIGVYIFKVQIEDKIITQTILVN